jgi:hypothetical protein
VGISKYELLGSKNGMWRNLRTRCDTELMRQVLKVRFGFQEADIRTLTEAQATKTEIDRVFRSHLIAGAERGDVVVFYFSGHGQLVPDSSAFGGLRGSLVTANYTDGTGPAGYRDNLRSDEVRELLRTLKDKMKGADCKVDGNITVLFDSCHSGNATKGDLEEKGRPWDPTIDGPIPLPKPGLGVSNDVGTKGSFSDYDRDAAIAEGYVFISACRNAGLPYGVAFCPQPGTEASIFTYHLTRRLARSTPQTTYKALFEVLSTDISSGQIPQLEGDETKLLLAGAALPGEQYLVVQAVDGKKLTLPVGFVQGEAEGSRYTLYRAEKSVRDPRNKLGEAKVVDVATSSCTAELDGPGANAITPDELKAARAVELERAFGVSPLYVLFEGIDPPAGLATYRMLRTADEKGKAITKANYHVRVRLAGTLDSGTGREVLIQRHTGKEVLAPADGIPKPRPNKIWVQGRNGDVLSEFSSDARAPEIIPDVLFGEWKMRYLGEYLKRADDRNQTINVKLIVEAVTVKKDNLTGELQIKEVRKDVITDGTVRLRDDDNIRLSVQNASSGNIPVFVTIVRIGRDGLFSIYPPEGTPNDTLAANRIEPNTPPFALPFVVHLTKPYGLDLYKVIATTSPANFSGLLFRRVLPPGVIDKGPDDNKVKQEIAKLPAAVHPLALLLTQVKAGAKGGDTMYLGTQWATAEKYVEVLAPVGGR